MTVTPSPIISWKVTDNYDGLFIVSYIRTWPSSELEQSLSWTGASEFVRVPIARKIEETRVCTSREDVNALLGLDYQAVAMAAQARRKKR
jgi:hypothetical protein